MKKQYLTAAALALFLTANAENKFDARGEIIADQYRTFRKDPSQLLFSAEQLPFSTDIVSRAGSAATAAVILADGITADQIADFGFEINEVSRSVVLIKGTMENIIKLSESDLVKTVSFPDTVDPCLNYAREYTGVNTIHQGNDGLPQAYTGKGVITAIFDSGFYPDHINFKDSDGTCRITNFWHYTDDNGTKFTHYDTPEKVVTIPGGTDATTSSHGTHTMGCMAGYCYPNVKQLANYDQRTGLMETVNQFKEPNGRPMPFYGMSKESEIIAAAGILSTANMMAGIKNMADYIKASRKPGVLNLSIGSMIGPRDGSDVFGVFINEIAEDLTVCIAAGNDGDTNNSLTGEAYNTFIAAPSATTTVSGTFDLWGNDNKPFDVSIVLYDRAQSKIIYQYDIKGGQQQILGTSNYSNVTVKNTEFDKAFSSSYFIFSPKKLDTNNRYNVYFQYNLTNKKTTNNDGNIVCGIMVKAAQGSHVDLAHRPSAGGAVLANLNVPGWRNGSSDMTISSMACGPNVLAVGAWNTRNEWGILPKSVYHYVDTEGLELDDIAGYSSYGRLYNGEGKPDLTAPGTGIISSVSTPGAAALEANSSPCARYTSGSRSDSWGMMQGTSMATPVVAGGIALWLEADPSLTPAEIREIAKSTCTTDSYTAKGNPLRWGNGKFNALAGLKKVLGSTTGITDISTDASDKFQVTATGNSCWEVFVPGAATINTRLVNLAGQTVMNTSAEGDQALIDTSSLSAGVYILNVNGRHSTRIAVK